MYIFVLVIYSRCRLCLCDRSGRACDADHGISGRGRRYLRYGVLRINRNVSDHDGITCLECKLNIGIGSKCSIYRCTTILSHTVGAGGIELYVHRKLGVRIVVLRCRTFGHDLFDLQAAVFLHKVIFVVYGCRRKSRRDRTCRIVDTDFRVTLLCRGNFGNGILDVYRDIGDLNIVSCLQGKRYIRICSKRCSYCRTTILRYIIGTCSIELDIYRKLGVRVISGCSCTFGHHLHYLQAAVFLYIFVLVVYNRRRRCCRDRTCTVRDADLAVTDLCRICLSYGVLHAVRDIGDHDSISSLHSERYVSICSECCCHCRATVLRHVICTSCIELDIYCVLGICIVLFLGFTGNEDLLDREFAVLLHIFILVIYNCRRRRCGDRTCTIRDADFAVTGLCRIHLSYGVLHIYRDVGDHDSVACLYCEGYISICSECCSYCCTTVLRNVICTSCIELDIYCVLGICIVLLLGITGNEDLLNREFAVFLDILILVINSSILRCRIDRSCRIQDRELAVSRNCRIHLGNCVVYIFRNIGDLDLLTGLDGKCHIGILGKDLANSRSAVNRYIVSTCSIELYVDGVLSIRIVVLLRFTICHDLLDLQAAVLLYIFVLIVYNSRGRSCRDRSCRIIDADLAVTGSRRICFGNSVLHAVRDIGDDDGVAGLHGKGNVRILFEGLGDSCRSVNGNCVRSSCVELYVYGVFRIGIVLFLSFTGDDNFLDRKLAILLNILVLVVNSSCCRCLRDRTRAICNVDLAVTGNRRIYLSDGILNIDRDIGDLNCISGLHVERYVSVCIKYSRYCSCTVDGYIVGTGCIKLYIDCVLGIRIVLLLRFTGNEDFLNDKRTILLYVFVAVVDLNFRRCRSNRTCRIVDTNLAVAKTCRIYLSYDVVCILRNVGDHDSVASLHCEGYISASVKCRRYCRCSIDGYIVSAGCIKLNVYGVLRGWIVLLFPIAGYEDLLDRKFTILLYVLVLVVDLNVFRSRRDRTSTICDVDLAVTKFCRICLSYCVVNIYRDVGDVDSISYFHVECYIRISSKCCRYRGRTIDGYKVGAGCIELYIYRVLGICIVLLFPIAGYEDFLNGKFAVFLDVLILVINSRRLRCCIDRSRRIQDGELAVSGSSRICLGNSVVCIFRNVGDLDLLTRLDRQGNIRILGKDLADSCSAVNRYIVSSGYVELDKYRIFHIRIVVLLRLAGLHLFLDLQFAVLLYVFILVVDLYFRRCRSNRTSCIVDTNLAVTQTSRIHFSYGVDRIFRDIGDYDGIPCHNCEGDVSVGVKCSRYCRCTVDGYIVSAGCIKLDVYGVLRIRIVLLLPITGNENFLDREFTILLYVLILVVNLNVFRCRRDRACAIRDIDLAVTKTCRIHFRYGVVNIYRDVGDVDNISCLHGERNVSICIESGSHNCSTILRHIVCSSFIELDIYRVLRIRIVVLLSITGYENFLDKEFAVFLDVLILVINGRRLRCCIDRSCRIQDRELAVSGSCRICLRNRVICIFRNVGDLDLLACLDRQGNIRILGKDLADSSSAVNRYIVCAGYVELDIYRIFHIRIVVLLRLAGLHLFLDLQVAVLLNVLVLVIYLYFRRCRCDGARTICDIDLAVTKLSRIHFSYGVDRILRNVGDDDRISSLHGKCYVSVCSKCSSYCRCAVDGYIVSTGYVELNVYGVLGICIVLLFRITGYEDLLNGKLAVLLYVFVLVVDLYFRRCRRDRTGCIVDTNLAVAKSCRISLCYDVGCILRNVGDHDGISCFHGKCYISVCSKCSRYCRCAVDGYIVGTGCIELNVYGVLGIRIVLLFCITGYEDLLDGEFAVLLYVFVLVVDLYFRRCRRDRTCTIRDIDLAVTKASRICFCYGVVRILRNVGDHDGISRLQCECDVGVCSESCSHSGTTILRYVVGTGYVELNIYGVLGICIVLLLCITGYEDLLDGEFTILLYVFVLVIYLSFRRCCRDRTGCIVDTDLAVSKSGRICFRYGVDNIYRDVGDHDSISCLYRERHIRVSVKCSCYRCCTIDGYIVGTGCIELYIYCVLRSRIVLLFCITGYEDLLNGKLAVLLDIVVLVVDGNKIRHILLDLLIRITIHDVGQQEVSRQRSFRYSITCTCIDAGDLDRFAILQCERLFHACYKINSCRRSIRILDIKGRRSIQRDTYSKLHACRTFSGRIGNGLCHFKGTLILICICIVDRNRCFLGSRPEIACSICRAVCRFQSKERVLRLGRFLNDLVIARSCDRDRDRFVRLYLKDVLRSIHIAVFLDILVPLLNDELILHVILAIIVRKISEYFFAYFQIEFSVVVSYLNLGIAFQSDRLCLGSVYSIFRNDLLSVDRTEFRRRNFFDGISAQRDIGKYTVYIISVLTESKRRIRRSIRCSCAPSAGIKDQILIVFVLDRKIHRHAISCMLTVHMLVDGNASGRRRTGRVFVLVIDRDRLRIVGRY